MSAFETDLPGAHTWYLLRGKSRSPEASVIPLNISILHPYQTGAQKQSEMFTENSWSTVSHQRRKQSRLCVHACPLLTLQKVLLSPFSWDEAHGLTWEKGLGFIKNSRLHFLRTENMGCFFWEVGGRLRGINPKDWAFFLMSCREGMEWMFWFGWKVG